MQTPPIPLPHTWTDLFWFGLAIITANALGGGVVGAILTAILSRKKRSVTSADIHESEARTTRTLAEARSLDLQTNISAGDAVLRMVQQLTFAQIANEKLHEENERLAIENETYEAQLRRAKAALKLHGIVWGE